MKPFSKLLISLACGLLALIMVGGYVIALSSSADARRNQALKSFASKSSGAIVKVVVARNDLPPGGKISADDIVLKDWVVDLLPAGAFDKISGVTGKQVKSLILAGEPISATRLGDSGTISLTVPAGFSAVSIPSRDVLAVGGAVTRGSKVDIYVSTGQDAYILAENVVVLATSTDSSGGAGKGGLTDSSSALTWVTIAVKSSDVGAVVRASAGSEMHLVLRSGSAPAQTQSQPPSGSQSTTGTGQ